MDFSVGLSDHYPMGSGGGLADFSLVKIEEVFELLAYLTTIPWVQAGVRPTLVW